MQIGWLKLHRQLLDWEWYSDVNTSRVFFHLLLTANFEDKNWRGETVMRGQRLYGLEQMAVETGLTVSKLRTAINNLKKTGEIANKTTPKGSIITITNYDKYQGDVKQDDKQIANESQTNDKQIATTKELKNIRSKEIDMFYLQGESQASSGEKKYRPEFELFYEKFPKTRKGSRENAYPAWKRAITKSTEKEIMDGLEAYIASDTVAKGYVKGAAAWLNDDGWKSDYSRKQFSAKPEQRYSETKKNVVTL